MFSMSLFPRIRSLILRYFSPLAHLSLIFSEQIQDIFAFSYYSFCYFDNNFIFLFRIKFLYCVLSWKFANLFSFNFYLCINPAYFKSLNDDIVGMEKTDRIYSLTFVADDFSGLFFTSITLLSKIGDLHKQLIMFYQIYGID